VKKKFFNTLLSITLISTLALTFNVINYSTEVQAKVNDTKEEKVFIKHNNASLLKDSNDSLRDDYITIHPVPENFDAINATDKELEYYKFPKRPTDVSKLAKWKKIVSCKWVKPDLIETGLTHSTYNKNTTTSSSAKLNTVTSENDSQWSGYAYTEPCTSIDSDWSLPEVSAASNYIPAAASQWVGLGGYGIPTLVQAGTSGTIDKYGSKDYYFWYELLGTDYSPDTETEIHGISCSPGDDVYTKIKTSVSGSATIVDFYMANFSQNTSTSFTKTLTGLKSELNSAEWICEAPLSSATNSNYNYPITTDTYFKTKIVAFIDSSYMAKNTNTFSDICKAPNLMKISLVNGSTVISEPTAIGSGSRPSLFALLGGNNNSFDVNWKNYK